MRKKYYVSGIIGICLLGVYFIPKPHLLQEVSFSQTVVDRNGELLRMTLSSDEKYRLFTPLEDIPLSLREAVLLYEDQYFYWHKGVNPGSIIRALFWNLIPGKAKVGASTLTMQLARVKYKLNTRTILGKIIQIGRALQLERHYTKNALLEAYFNLAPYGYNIEGVGAASKVYFHKEPRYLSIPESLALAVIPQSPTKRRPDTQNFTKPALMRARERLFEKWRTTVPEDDLRIPFFSQPLMTYGRSHLPYKAPHAVHNLLARYPSSPKIMSTLDWETQNLLETLLRNYVNDRREVGIVNASALLIDIRTSEVLARIGSADFFNTHISGQIDGTRAKRSPGSTLKPFIYALGLDQGLIHPYTLLNDTPMRFGRYNPENFEHNFHGPISAHQALHLSLNIPALRLAMNLTHPTLYEFLQKAGVRRLQPAHTYGISLVLGTAEVTMEELARLYMMLAQDGLLEPLVDHKMPVLDKKKEPPTSLLSPEASFITLDMLRNTPRPLSAQQRSEKLPVYWKTGTSPGLRDAWAAGVFGPYVLVVWAGNFNSRMSPSLVGIRTAAPLFFSMIEALNQQNRIKDRIQKKSAYLKISRIPVCIDNGNIGPECRSKIHTWFIPGVSPIRKFSTYQRVLINQITGERACRDEEGITAYQTFEVSSTELQNTLENAGIYKMNLPPWEKECSSSEKTPVAQGKNPIIHSPHTHTDYKIRLGEETIPFMASAEGDVETLYWFVGRHYIGKTQPGGVLNWNSQPGHYKVRVVDNYGRSTTTSLVISHRE